MLRLFVLVLLCGCASATLYAGEAKDPLAKFKEEELSDIGFCFNKFVESIGAKDAETVKAFLSQVPKGLAQLDLKKEADKAAFLKAFEKYAGAQITSSQRMPAGGLGQVTYQGKGGEKTLRMSLEAGVWKVVGD